MKPHLIVSACLVISLPLLAAEPHVRVVTNPGVDFDDAHRTWQGIPSIERTRGGRLFVAWYSGGDREGSTENYSLAAISDDDGRTWSKPVLVVQGLTAAGAGVRCGEPLPWLDPRGRLWVMWNNGSKDPDAVGTWAIRCDNPDAPPGSWEWSKPVLVGPGIVLGKPLVRTNGDWLAPLEVRGSSPLAKAIGKNIAGVVVSTDEGATWTWRGGFQVADEIHNFAEHCLVERVDGSIWTVLRVSAGEYGLYESGSADGGRTWSPPTPFMKGTATRAALHRLPSGKFLLIYHDGGPHPRKDGSPGYTREALTAFLSADEGKTWKKKLLLDPRTRVSYPDATIAPDGRIFITYDYARYERPAKEILFNVITEEMITTGRVPGTPTVVNRATGLGNVTETGRQDEEKMRKEVNRKLLDATPKK